ncbi:MAG: hypothetical protein KAT29_01785, partial [Anaerolineales bacterium]|nr:hypothetical protein [Anaerolineales bacterium]
FSQVFSDTRTDLTQPSSRQSNPSSALCKTPPTLPPGLLGVDFGEPTVPNEKDNAVIEDLAI